MKDPLLLVTDTNIWIDLENGNLLELIFKLPYQFVTSDFATHEIHPTLWAFLETLGVKAHGLSSEQILDIYTLNQNHHSVSTTDISCLVLARDLPAILVSGDKQLRKLAEAHTIKVHGVLWLLDEIVNHRIITAGKAYISLKRMLAQNSRLPEGPCNKRLNKWGAQR